MYHEIELSKYWCPRKDCKDYGKTGKGNIIIKEKYGKEGRYLLKCKTCKHCFSETRGTAFFCLHAPKEEVLRFWRCFPKKEAFVVWLAQRIIAKARSLAGLRLRGSIAEM